VAYDVEAESRALIAHGLTEDPVRLSRRRRFAAMAVDVDGDVACTKFVRRSVGSFEHMCHVLVRRGAGWLYLGGGGSGAETDGLEDRPAARQLGGHVVVQGSGGVADDTGRRMPWSGRWISYAELRVSASATSVHVGDRVLPVPRHGHVVVVWTGRRAPVAVAHGADGRPLAGVGLPGRRSPAELR
jgi:hypothetical protein